MIYMYQSKEKQLDERWTYRDCVHRSFTLFWSVSVAGTECSSKGLVTPKWRVRSGRNSNLSESWLSAGLTKIRSIMNVLAYRHHFPIIRVWEFFRCSVARNFDVNRPIRPEFKPVRDLPVLDTSRQVWQRSDQKWLRKGGDTISPHYKSMNGRFWLPWQPQFWSNH